MGSRMGNGLELKRILWVLACVIGLRPVGGMCSVVCSYIEGGPCLFFVMLSPIYNICYMVQFIDDI